MHPSMALEQAYGPLTYPEHTLWRVPSNPALSGSTRITETTQVPRGVYQSIAVTNRH